MSLSGNLFDNMLNTNKLYPIIEFNIETNKWLCSNTGPYGFHIIELPGITKEQVDAYLDGAFVQDAFPNLNNDLREFIITGIPPGKWDEFLGFEEDENEEYIPFVPIPKKINPMSKEKTTKFNRPKRGKNYPEDSNE